MVRQLPCVVLGLALLSCGASALRAQDAVLTEFYGRGVHAYFAGDLGTAMEDLTAAISGGTKDPRAYYFRALTEMRLGDHARAEADLRAGAALESADVNQFYPVGKALERVQGPARLALERYRVVARAEAHERQLKRDAARYEERRRAETKVLRDPKFVQPPKPPVPAPGPAADADELFGDEKAVPKPPKADLDDAPVEGVDDMPADEPTPPAADEPADDPAAEPADDAAMPAEPAADGDDPFKDEADPK